MPFIQFKTRIFSIGYHLVLIVLRWDGTNGFCECFFNMHLYISIEIKLFIAQFHVHRLCCAYNFLGSRHKIRTVWHWQRDTFRWFACSNSIITSHQSSRCLSTFNVPIRWLSNVFSWLCKLSFFLSHNLTNLTNTSNEIILERGYYVVERIFMDSLPLNLSRYSIDSFSIQHENNC